jgi:glycosyltransferase involved in cell wall biosynthesis
MLLDSLKSYKIAAERKCNQLFGRDIISLTSVSENNRSVLLSYITHPFKVKSDDLSFYSHTNTWECQQIAKTWLNYGYSVDVIDWDNSRFVPKKEYAVFIDIHSNMERIAPLLKNDCKKILHITGAHWRFQNAAEMKRLSDLKRRRDILLKPRRQVEPSFGIENADCATILGNAFTQGTFAYANKPLYPIPLSTTIQYPFIEKNFDKIRKNFLWLGSSGMVHKGLDLVLDVFSKLLDYNLTVCGPVNQEPDFEKAFFKELYQSPNIRTLGLTDVNSAQFMDVIKNTSFLIYPSCSEGQAGSVITCLHAGLIPVISCESGVDVEDFGILLENSSIDEITNSVKMISQKSSENLHLMSKKAWLYARTNHTREKFAECYDSFVKNIILK